MSRIERTRVGDVIELVREPVEIDLATKYERLGLRSFGRGLIRHPPVPGSEVGKLRFYSVRANELVLSHQMAWEGAIAVTSESDSHLIASNRFLTYASREPARADVSYLRYFFLSDRGMAMIRRASPGSTIRNRTLGIKAFESIEIPLPTLDEQRRISAVIDRVESVVRLGSNRRRLAVVLPQATINKTFAHISLGQYPLVAVGDVLRLERQPIEIDSERTYRKIGVRSFGNGLIHYQPQLGDSIGKLRFYSVTPNALILSNIKAWEGAISVTTIEDVGFVASNRFLMYVPAGESTVDVNYLNYFFLSDSGLRLIQRASPGSADRNRTLGIRSFESLSIPLPALAEQSKIANHLDRVRLLAALVFQRLDALDALLPSVLNATFADESRSSGPRSRRVHHDHVPEEP
jgi:type I restriction enzyme S subunit